MIWKDIPGYEDLYQASDCGQVKSLAGTKLGSLKKEKILKPGLTKYGYEQVNLCKEGVIKKYKVHRLVMFAHSHVDTELTVNHIDENKRNNHISNLEYCTQGENVRKHRKNNPDFAKECGKKGGHKIYDTKTGITYASMSEVGVMMQETGEASSRWIWRNILRDGKSQDRFVRI
jgi:hypothetical protein